MGGVKVGKKKDNFGAEVIEDPNKMALGSITFFDEEKEEIFNLLGYFDEEDINDTTTLRIAKNQKIVGAKV